MKTLKENKKIILILTTLLFISSLWLIKKGLPWHHDVEFHYTRLVGLYKCINNGDYLGYILDTNYGYGYAAGIFYSNLFLYIPALLSKFMSYMNAYKIMLILINLGTILTIYYTINKIINNKKISVIGTIIYMFSAYRMIDIYVRGALGEIIAFMIVPIILLGLFEIIYGNSKKWWLFSIGFALLLYSHLISTFLMFIFALIIILFNYKRFLLDKSRIKYLIISAIIGLLLAASNFLPIIEQYLNADINIFKMGSTVLPQDNTVSFRNLILPNSITSFYIGISIILMIPIRILFKKKNINIKNYDMCNFADLIFILGIISWLFTTKIFPWNVVGHQLSFIQFPWRLLLISTLFIIIANTIYFYILETDIKYKYINYIYKVLIILSLLTVSIYSIQYGYRRNHYNVFDENELGTFEYLPYNTDPELLVNDYPEATTNNSELEYNYEKKGTNVVIYYKNNNKNDTYIEIPLLNYLGYKANGATITNGTNNLIRC